MKNTLAVVAPMLGAQSETFIRRHMQDLLPGQTVVVAGSADKPQAGHWTVTHPTLILGHQTRSGLYRLRRNARKKLGLPPADEATLAKSFLKSSNVSVILGEYLDVSLPYLKLAQQLSIPFFAHAHGYDVSIRLRNDDWKKKYLEYNQASGVITMSETSKRRLIDLGIQEEKVFAVPYGIDVLEQPMIRQEDGMVRCVAVGRMVGKKAPILTLDAFRRAAEACPSLHLDYVGGGELLPAARQFVRAFGLEERVTLHGAQPSEFVMARMAQADIFLQHSIVDPDTGDEEGLPVALLEAMGLALPVVSTRHAGIPEAVVEGETGYLVDEGDSRGMSERLIALAQDAALRQQIGRAGWQRARDHFSWERERTKLLQVMGLTSQDNPIKQP